MENCWTLSDGVSRNAYKIYAVSISGTVGEVVTRKFRMVYNGPQTTTSWETFVNNQSKVSATVQLTLSAFHPQIRFLQISWGLGRFPKRLPRHGKTAYEKNIVSGIDGMEALVITTAQKFAKHPQKERLTSHGPSIRRWIVPRICWWEPRKGLFRSPNRRRWWVLLRSWRFPQTKWTGSNHPSRQNAWRVRNEKKRMISSFCYRKTARVEKRYRDKFFRTRCSDTQGRNLGPECTDPHT